MRASYRLGARSLAELKGVHPALVSVVHEAIGLTAQDFSVHDGVRNVHQQAALVRAGASRTLTSKHRVQADGFGHAVDLVPWINGRMRWEWPAIYPIATAMRRAAGRQGVSLVWGGVWDRAFLDLPDDAKGL